MNLLLAFGLILLAITLGVYPHLQKEVEDPWCPNDVEAVSNNKKYFKIFLVASIVMVIAGLFFMIFC